MTFKTIVLATTIALSTSAAFAQAGGYGAGAAVPENSGTAVDGNGVAVGQVEHGRMMNRAPGTTTGSATSMGTREQINRGSMGNRTMEPGGPDGEQAAPAGR